MSCRTTPAGSLATTFVVQHLGLSDRQATSLYHELIREWHDTDPLERPPLGRRDYVASVAQIESALRGDGQVSERMRERLNARAARAMAAEPPSDEARLYAFTRMLSRSAEARAAIDSYVRRVAQYGRQDETDVAERFRTLARTRGVERQERRDGLDAGLPSDDGTLYAVNTLLEEARASRGARQRCPDCGEWTSPDSTHVCRESGDTSPSNVHTETARAVPPPTAAIGNEPVSMDQFQSLYDSVMSERGDGAYRLPTLTELENEPGGVTGGLASPDGGMSFGLELEVDFPDEDADDWGTARELLAARLYNEGIGLTPRFQRWHYVGDEGAGRPGGSFDTRPDGWICEFDRSVDGVEGARGVEIKSQILYDTPETWHNLRRICEIVEELGGKATPRCGVHVNIGGSDLSRDDPTVHSNLIRLARAYDDVLVRMSHNPESGPQHRGRHYCAPVNMPPEGFRSVSEARDYANHYQAVNLNRVGDEYNAPTGSSRVEMRLFDSSLDPNRIQTQVALSLALVNAAKTGDAAKDRDEMVAGTQRSRFGRRRLEGEEWEDSTEPVRSLLGLMRRHGLGKAEQQAQAVRLFAASRWQSS